MLLYLIISLISYHITLKGEREDNKKEGLPPLLNTRNHYRRLNKRKQLCLHNFLLFFNERTQVLGQKRVNPVDIFQFLLSLQI